MGRYGRAWDGMGGHGTVWEGMGRHGRAWDGMGGHGTVWDGMGRGRYRRPCPPNPQTRPPVSKVDPKPQLTSLARQGEDNESIS